MFICINFLLTYEVTRRFIFRVQVKSPKSYQKSGSTIAVMESKKLNVVAKESKDFKNSKQFFANRILIKSFEKGKW